MTESNMLGHEIINLFQDDNGHHYIYVVPWGLVGRDHTDKVGTIILARHIGNSQVEIIAKAKVKGEAFPGVNQSRLGLKNKTNQQDENKFKELKKRKQVHGKFCNGISYGGIPITDIYHYFDENDIQQILVSYEVEDFRFSKPDEKTNQLLRLSYKTNNIIENNLIPMKSNMAKTSLREFFANNVIIEKEMDEDKRIEKENKSDDYKTLKELVNDSRYWEAEDNSKKINGSEYVRIEQRSNYLISIIGKEDSELVFSRLFCHFFKNKQLLNSFITSVLNQYGVLEVDDYFEVTQEEDRIDIKIEDRKQTIIIENKIKSGINGQKEELSKADNLPISQLSVYYNNYHCDNGHFFIFVPDYNRKQIENKKKELSCGQYYQVISYSALYSFFCDKQWDGMDYIDEFRNALFRHTSEYPDTLREDTYRKFLERIIELNNTKKDSTS